MVCVYKQQRLWQVCIYAHSPAPSLLTDAKYTKTWCLSDSLTGVTSSILVRSHPFVEIDHEIISKAILPSSADSRRVVVSYKRKYVHEVLVNHFVKLAQEKSVAR